MDVEYVFLSREQREKIRSLPIKKYDPIEEFKKRYGNYLFQKTFHSSSTPPEPKIN